MPTKKMITRTERIGRETATEAKTIIQVEGIEALSGRLLSGDKFSPLQKSIQGKVYCWDIECFGVRPINSFPTEAATFYQMACSTQLQCLI